MKPRMPIGKRVGVIEIGSRGVRLLLGEIGNATFTPVARHYDSSVRLMDALVLPGDHIGTTLQDIRRVVDQYVVLCQNMDVAELTVVGTEAVRRLQRTMPGEFKILHRAIPDLKVLGPKEEAFYSLVAAFRSLPYVVVTGDIAMTIDIGAGSIEVALGKHEGEQIKLMGHRGLPLGTDILVSRLKEVGGDYSKLEGWIGQKAGKRALRGAAKAVHSIVLGSVPTKLAWIRVRHSLSERYDPRRVHGEHLTRSAIQQFIQISAQPGVPMREIVDPENPESGEFETILAGSVALVAFMEWLRRDEVVVCAEALRYGIAWNLASSIKNAR